MLRRGDLLAHQSTQHRTSTDILDQRMLLRFEDRCVGEQVVLMAFSADKAFLGNKCLDTWQTYLMVVRELKTFECCEVCELRNGLELVVIDVQLLQCALEFCFGQHVAVWEQVLPQR